jgi:hypothetical protein
MRFPPRLATSSASSGRARARVARRDRARVVRGARLAGAAWVGGLAALTCALLAAVAMATDSSERAPAPASLEEMPSASKEDVTRLLRKIRHKYGDDALLIDTHLLLNAMKNGSVLATGARVEGVKDYRGKRYLGFHVETGLVFDDNTRNETARVHMLWHTIMTPTLERLNGLTVPADGIMVRMQYHHFPYRTLAELRDRIHEPGPSEETVFYLLTPDVTELLAKRVSKLELIARARIAIDGSEREITVPAAEEPLSAGPN